MKKAIALFSGIFALMLACGFAFAQEANQEAHKEVSETVQLAMQNTNIWYAIAAAITMSITSAVGALSQSKAAATALEAIGRNPGAASKIQTPMIIALALIESLVIYGLLIAFFLQGKIA